MVKTRTTKKSIKNKQEEVLFEKNANTAIAEIAKLYLSHESLSLGDISELVLDQAKKLTKSPYGFVAYMDPATGYLMAETLTRDVWNECKIPNKSVVFKKFTGIWGWVLNNKKTVLTNKVIHDPRYKGIPKGHVRMEKFLASPALLGNKLLGMVAVANSSSDYADRERRYIEILADFYAIALQRKFTEDALKQRETELIHARAVESISKLTSGIAHDFNNVLSAIDGYAALMLESIDRKSPMRFAIGEIKKTVSRAVKITNSLQKLGITHKIKI